MDYMYVYLTAVYCDNHPPATIVLILTPALLCVLYWLVLQTDGEFGLCHHSRPSSTDELFDSKNDSQTKSVSKNNLTHMFSTLISGQRAGVKMQQKERVNFHYHVRYCVCSYVMWGL